MANPPEIITFAFSVDNPCNTTITDGAGQVLYITHTESGNKASTTRVFEGTSDTVVAELVWSDTGLITNRVKLRGEKELALREWMHKSKLPFVDNASFMDDQGRRYKWKGLAAGRALELYTEDDGHKQPIAGFHKAILDKNETPPKKGPATLRLAPRADEIRELLVCSFLFLEIIKRTKEKGFGDMNNRMGGGLLAVA